MRPLSHEAGKLLVGQLLVMDSFLLFLCLLHNRNAGNAGISQIGCIGVHEGAFEKSSIDQFLYAELHPNL